MHFSSIALLAGAVSVTATQYQAGTIVTSPFGGLAVRQDVDCVVVPVGPNLCERSCGPGYISCVYESLCYNPRLGQSCCADGKYCPAGTYCADTTCCPEGMSLEECGATEIVNEIPPPSEESREPSSVPSPTDDEDDVTPTPTPTPTETTTATPTETITPPSSRPPHPTGSGEPPMPTGTGGLPHPPGFTGGADRSAHAANFALGGLGLLAFWL